MPTPSSHNTDDSHTFTSSCPDEQAPHSPSSWHPPPPYPLDMDEVRAPRDMLDDHDSASRSTTLSPRPDSRSGSGGDASGPALHSPSDPDDSNKHSDADEEMRTGDQVGGSAALGVSGLTEAHVIEGQIYTSGGSRRRQNRHSLRDTTQRGSYHDRVDDLEATELDGFVDELGTSMGYEYSNMRLIPTTPSSFLRPGSRFTGTQQSERQVYDVHVEIKHVDLRESFLCGYLRIQGLTEDHPTLTTYFEGEIIGSKYGFMTKHESWGANDRIDLSHWSKFAAFRPFAKQAKKGNTAIKDVAQREHIFMRWKEHFLVPDHRVRTINGASFEGFYYICFNQIQGEVSGIYFHSKSEKFQQLELKHVENRGCYSAMEFR